MERKEPITFEYEGKRYVLEFTRNTVLEMERNGFDLSKVGSQLLNATVMLWNGAFLANHRKTSEKTRNEIFSLMGNKESLFQRLTELYTYAASSIFDTEGIEEKNLIKWN